MRKFLARYKGLFTSFLLITLVTTAFWFFDVRDLCAHSPHDLIDALELSPAYDQDKTLFITISEHLRKSTDGGFDWKELVNGLDHKHSFSSIAISPSFQVDETLFVSSRGDGIYRSEDGGGSWVKVNSGLDSLSIGLLSISPAYYDGIVLATGSEEGLYRTKDGGESWHQVINNSKITAIAFSPDLKKNHIIAGDHRGVLYLSTDGGEIWQQIYQFSSAGAITAIAVSTNFSLDGTFFVGTEKGGIFRTIDGGASFVEINEGLRFTTRGKYGTFRKSEQGPIIRPDKKDIISIAISPDYEADSTVFVSMWNEAVFKSDDGGSTWRRYTIGLTCDFQADSAEYKSPHFRALRISSSYEDDKTIFLGGFDGLFKSTDSGRHWAQMETLPLRLVKGLALSPGEQDDLSVAIIAYGGGACTTHDQGTTWAINNNGLETTRLSDVVFSPGYQTDNILFSGSRGYLLRSTDRGNTWEKIELDYTANWTTRWRRFASRLMTRFGIPSFLSQQILTSLERERPYPTVLAISPNFASDNILYFATRYHGIFRSVDGGLNPSITWDGMAHTITSLVISPDFSSDETLFASVRGAAIYKTVDGGYTWQPANNGLTFLEAWQSPTVGDITKKDIWLAISPHYRVDKTVFAACSEGLFKTTDGGDSWRELRDPAYGEDAYVIGVAISPDYENDGTSIIGVRGKGLFKTENGGTTFTEIGSDLIDNNYEIEYIAFSASYATDNTIYAASDEELFESTDGGNAWQMITRPARYENMRDVVYYEGDWNILRGDDFSASSVSCSDVAHDKSILNFVGTGVTWIGTQSNDQGNARVYIDGNHVGDVDQFGDIRKPMVRSFSVTDLAYGPHTIVVEVTGTKNPESKGCRIEIDAFDIAP